MKCLVSGDTACECPGRLRFSLDRLKGSGAQGFGLTTMRGLGTDCDGADRSDWALEGENKTDDGGEAGASEHGQWRPRCTGGMRLWGGATIVGIKRVRSTQQCK